MSHGTRAMVWVPLVAILVATTDGGCQDVHGNHLRQEVQHAVGTGAQGELAPTVQPARIAVLERATQPQPAVTPRISHAADVPVAHIEGSGADARLVVAEDADHRSVGNARLGERYGTVWTDAEGGNAYFATFDDQARPQGPSQVIHHAVSEEEGIASPVVMASSDGFGVAWVDPENGRVRFRRVSADGAVQGRASIVHEGLEAPRVTRMVWTGREFGLAVGQWRGVYFARIADDGERIGDGVLIDEGTTVGSLDGIDWDGRGYTVSWSQHHDGTATHLRQRVGGDGRRVGCAAITGAISRSTGTRGGRRAT